MKYDISKLTFKQVERIFDVLMDSEQQQELQQEGHPDAWMLDFVYDAQLRDQLIKWHCK